METTGLYKVERKNGRDSYTHHKWLTTEDNALRFFGRLETYGDDLRLVGPTGTTVARRS